MDRVIEIPLDILLIAVIGNLIFVFGILLCTNREKKK